jgi:PilZ domain-containing protein
MRRLAAQQPVVLDLEEEAIECVVEAVAGDEATIAPVTAADAGYIPRLGRAAALVFAAAGGGARTRVRGAVHRAAGEGRLQFVAGGGADLPARRQAARAGVDLPVDLEPEGEPARRLATTDVSIGGIGVRIAGWRPSGGEHVRFALELPAAPPIRGTARVLRVAEGVAGLAIEEIAPIDRARLAAFLIASSAA